MCICFFFEYISSILKLYTYGTRMIQNMYLHLLILHIRRPRPEPWPGRRLGPPLVWTSSAAKLKAVASQVFLFLAKPKASNASNLSKPAKRALGAASIEAVASQVVPFLVPNCCCQTSGCGKPSLSVSTGPKLPDAPPKSCKPSKLFEKCQSCQIRGCGKPSGCKTSGRGKPSLSFSTGPKLPDAPSKGFKGFKPFKPFKPLQTCQAGSWSCQTKPSGSFSCAKLLLPN